jgi:predicted RNA binding protein YcfA (HicA-like mRNA interferase family)
MHLHDIERELLRGGWRLARIRGSHRHYRQDESGRRLTVSIHSGPGATAARYSTASCGSCEPGAQWHDLPERYPVPRLLV